MAHFARVINGQVVKVHVLANAVITDENGEEHEEWGQTFLANLHGYQPEELVQCSYNGNQRGLYPGPGYLYNPTLDAFTPPQPYDSWVLNEETYVWEAPVELPADADTVAYVWDEETGAWVQA